MPAAVFFDRDGVLCRAQMVDGRPRAPLSLQEFQLEPDAQAAVQAVTAAGLLAVVVTNQPELATGELQPSVLEAIHRSLQAEVDVTAIYVCPHQANAGCLCHKPKPGLLERASVELDVNLGASFMIGDRWRDVGAGQAVGCRTVLIERPYSGVCRPDHRARSLGEAVAWVLGSNR